MAIRHLFPLSHVKTLSRNETIEKIAKKAILKEKNEELPIYPFRGYFGFLEKNEIHFINQNSIEFAEFEKILPQLKKK